MKTWSIALLLIVSLSLAACGAAPAAAPSAPAAAVAQKGGVGAVHEPPLQLPDDVDAKTVAGLNGRDDVVVLDVREPSEYAEGHIPGVKLIPVSEVPNRLNEIPKDKTVVVTCRSGNRSDKITDYLRQQGYDNVHNMTGGIVAWEAAGLPVEK